MSADSEIIALSALGIGRRRILLPVGVLAATGAIVTLAMTLWLTPLALKTLRRLEGELGASRLTLAESAIVIAAPRQGKLELHLKGGTTHDFDRNDPDHYSVTAFGQSDWPIEVTGLIPAQQTRQIKNDERSVRELATESGPNWREARVELHRRFVFPAACFAFALIAVPIGAQPRRGGRAAGSLIAVLLIAGYYLLLIFGSGLAREGTLPPIVGLWLANALLVICGLALLPRMEQFHGEVRWFQWIGRFRAWLRLKRLRRSRAKAAAAR